MWHFQSQYSSEEMYSWRRQGKMSVHIALIGAVGPKIRWLLYLFASCQLRQHLYKQLFRGQSTRIRARPSARCDFFPQTFSRFPTVCEPLKFEILCGPVPNSLSVHWISYFGCRGPWRWPREMALHKSLFLSFATANCEYFAQGPSFLGPFASQEYVKELQN